MLVGVNYPWIDYAWDFGDPPEAWVNPQYVAEWREKKRRQIVTDFRAFAEMGLFAVRWFILADGLSYGVGEAAPKWEWFLLRRVMPNLASVDHARDHDREFERLDRFGDMHVQASGERAQAVLAPRVGRQRDGRYPLRLRNTPLRLQLPNFLQRHVTVFIRHGDVQNQRVRPRAARGVGENAQRLRS